MNPTTQKPGTLMIEIGALCEPLSKQLAGHVSAEDGAILDQGNDAVTICYVSGLIDARSADRARKKLLNMCREAVRKFRARRS